MTSGDLTEVNINHKILGSKTMYPKSNEDHTDDLGGFSSDDDKNMIDGAGNMIDKMNQKRWKKGLTLAWDNDALTLEFLQALQNSPVQATYTFTHINLSVYVGTGKPVGDIEGNGNAGTIAVTFAGGGKLVKQA